MKLYVVCDPNKGIQLVDKEAVGIGNVLLGTIEVQEPKKTVTKETLPFPYYVPMRQLGSGQFEYINWREVTFYIPSNARNEKCTYEIEE